jgi:pimeloyl-ACP methyl ester carboxylesterase
MTAGHEQATGQEHWTNKGDVRLFLWEKAAAKPKGTVLFVHGSSMASQPTFDLQIPGRPSVMDWFVERGYSTWSVDMEGYGRSSKHRNINSDIATGADDLAAASDYIMKTRGAGPFLVYGISSGALRAAAFAERHPERVKRLALDAFVWTGEGSPTAKSACRSSRPRIAARSIAPSSIASSPATMPAPPRTASSRPSPTPSWRSTIRCRPAPMSTCARACR